MPNVVGLTQKRRDDGDHGAGLTVGTITTSSSTDGAGGIGDQSEPPRRDAVNVGSAVALVVSSGPPQVAVPKSLV